MKNPVKNILNKEMSRKEFLSYMGLMTITATGAFGVLNRMNDLDMFKFYPKQTKGFGSDSYGGKEKKI